LHKYDLFASIFSIVIMSQMVDKESQSHYVETKLPEDFLVDVQEQYEHGTSLVLTEHGSGLLERNPHFFPLLTSALGNIDLSIGNAISVQAGIVMRSFEDILREKTPPETSVNEETKESVTISYLGKGSQSWALLLQVGGEDQQYVIKLPCTKGAYLKLDSPLALLRAGKQDIPDYAREMMASENIETEFADANLHMPDYLMASGFFSIARYEGRKEIPVVAYQRKMVPLGQKIATEISVKAEIENRKEWDGVIPDWTIGKHDAFREREDGSYVCIDPVAIL